jgi:hypothetical protein
MRSLWRHSRMQLGNILESTSVMRTWALMRDQNWSALDAECRKMSEMFGALFATFGARIHRFCLRSTGSNCHRISEIQLEKPCTLSRTSGVGH